MKFDWNIILNTLIGSIPGILVAMGAAYTVFRDRLKVRAETSKIEEEKRKLESERTAIQTETRIKLENHYEDIAKELKAETSALRIIVNKLEFRVQRMDDVLEYVFSQVEEAFPEVVATAKKMLEQH